MKNNRIKIIYVLIFFLNFILGCNNNLKINIKYDNLKIDITTSMDAGCYENGEKTYFTHNIDDRYIYEFDFSNNIEYVKTEHWVSFNLDGKQYISGNSGKSYMISDEVSSEIFSKHYQSDFVRMLEYISTSEKSNISEKGNNVKFISDFGIKENEVFDIIKKFGAINPNSELKTIKTLVTVVDKDVINITFDVSFTDETGNFETCSKIEWDLSDFNNVKIDIPDDIR